VPYPGVAFVQVAEGVEGMVHVSEISAEKRINHPQDVLKTGQVVKAQGIVDGYVRPVAWRGAEQMGVSAQATKIHVAIAAWEWPAYFSPEARLKGIRMTISKWARPAPNTAPTASKAAGLYMICTLSKHAAEAAGYEDALMLDYRGQIAEATDCPANTVRSRLRLGKDALRHRIDADPRLRAYLGGRI